MAPSSARRGRPASATRYPRFTALAGPLLAACLTATCGDPSGPRVANVSISGPAEVHVGHSAMFTAAARSPGGDTVAAAVTWTSSDPLIAAVDQSGRVTGRAPGTVTLTATADGVSATTAVPVRLPPLRRIDVTPHADSLLVGDTIRLQVRLTDIYGGLAADRALTWSSSDTMKAVVAGGLVRARAPGSVAIAASGDGVTGGAFLNVQMAVVAVGMPDTLTLTLRDTVRLLPDLRSATGTRLSDRSIVWSSSDLAVAHVSAAGIVIPRQLGQALIVARAGMIADTTQLTVGSLPVAGIWLPWARNPVPGDSTVEAAYAEPYDVMHVAVPGARVTWSSSDTSVARVATDTLLGRHAYVTALRPGGFVLTAASEGHTATAGFSVVYPAARMDLDPESLSIDVGATARPGGRLRDRYGAFIGTVAPAWTLTDTAAATTGPGGIVGVAPGRATYIASFGAFTDTGVVVVQAPGTPHPAIHLWNQSVEQASMTPAYLTIYDDDGPWTGTEWVHIVSQDTSVAAVVPDSVRKSQGSALFSIQARREGHAVIMASVESGFTSATLEVRASSRRPRVTLAAAESVLAVSDSLVLSGTFRDINGQIWAMPLNWTTSDAAVATVTAGGVVRGQSPGVVRVIAAALGGADSLELTVTSPDGPVVTAVVPDTVIAGQVHTLRGSGFDPVSAANTVTLGGYSAAVLGGTDTTLTIRAPDLPCRPAHPMLLVTAAGGRVGTRLVTAGPVPVLTVVPGTVRAYDTAPGCVDIAAAHAGTWIAAVANTAPDSASLTVTALSQTAGPAPRPARPPAVVAGGAMRLPSDSLRAERRRHRHVLDGNRALMLRAGDPAPLLRQARARGGPARSVTATINGVARIRIPRVDRPDFCSSYESIDAREVYVGAHVRILEDVAAPLAGTMDSTYRALGAEYDTVIHPVVAANIGDPLALDALLDGDGRIAMVFSPVVNGTGAFGFVTACDFFPEAVAPSSNTGEVLYGIVPTDPTLGYASLTQQAWRWLIRSVIAHEAKHLAGVAERLARGLTPEEPWMEEATAVVAEELWSRRIYGNTWRGNALYRQTLFCDVRPSVPECRGRPYAMYNAFAFLNEYMQRPQVHSAFGPTASDDATFYGSGWALVRWVVDAFATTESTFLQSLTTDGRTGLDKLAALANRPASELLAWWPLALHTDNRRTDTSPPTGLPSWNLPDLFASMAGDFPADFSSDPSPYLYNLPVTLRLPGGTYALLSFGTTGTGNTVLRVTAPDGRAAPPNVSAALLRTR